jgi:hypothetical protein
MPGRHGGVAIPVFCSRRIFQLMYLKLRRLRPLIVAHWPMDLIAMLITLKF